MGRAHARLELAVQLQPLSDRLASQKMAQAYGLLVPKPASSIPPAVNQPTTEHEQISRDLCPCVLGPAEGG